MYYIFVIENILNNKQKLIKEEANMYKATNAANEPITFRLVVLVEVDAEERFVQTLKMYESFDHPNIQKLICHEIVAMFQIRVYAMALEFVDSVYKRTADPDITKRQILQLCSAVNYLHSKQIIHRDLKPENMLMTAAGDIKLCDFGFMRRLDNQNTMTRLGTPCYIAPEIWDEVEEVEEKSLGKYDNRADVWSIGVVGFQLCTGTLPYQASTFSELEDKIKNTVPNYDDIEDEKVKGLIKAFMIKNFLNRPFIGDYVLQNFAEEVAEMGLPFIK
jgi:serine/threonine protein kinase